MNKKTTHAETVASPRMEQIDPTTLLIDLNIRRDANPDRALVDSVRDLGVLVPLVAVRTQDGVRVRYGHRRTAAAIEAGRPTVPVWVFADDGGSGDVDRIVRQWAENEHRAALTDADRLAAVEQLAAFGITAAQITKQLRAPRKQVDAALTAANSTLAKAAVNKYDFLDLLQAATLAEFDAADDRDTIKALVAAAQQDPGQFEHIAQRARDDRAAQAREQNARDAIAATGVAVLPGSAPSRWATGAERLVRELNDPDGTRLTPAGHATCPGHAAYLVVEQGYWTADQASAVRLADEEPSPHTAFTEDPEYYDDATDDPDDCDDPEGPVEPAQDDNAEQPQWRHRFAAAYVCTDHAAHGHQPVYTAVAYSRQEPEAVSEAEAETRREAASAMRRLVIANNRSWSSAEKVRRTFLRALVQRKTPPKGAAAFVADALLQNNHAVRRAMEGQHTGLADLLDPPADDRTRRAIRAQPTLTGLLDGASDARAQVLVLAVILAAYEADTGKHSWRRSDPGTARYLRFLAAQGYQLAEVERLACGEQLEQDQAGDSAGDSAGNSTPDRDEPQEHAA